MQQNFQRTLVDEAQLTDIKKQVKKEADTYFNRLAILVEDTLEDQEDGTLLYTATYEPSEDK